MIPSSGDSASVSRSLSSSSLIIFQRGGGRTEGQEEGGKTRSFFQGVARASASPKDCRGAGGEGGINPGGSDLSPQESRER